MHVSRNRQPTRDIWGRSKGGRVGWIQRKSRIPPQTARKTVTRSRLYATSFFFLHDTPRPSTTPCVSPEKVLIEERGVKRSASCELEGLLEYGVESSESSEWEIEVFGNEFSSGHSDVYNDVVVIDCIYSSDHEEEDEPSLILDWDDTGAIS